MTQGLQAGGRGREDTRSLADHAAAHGRGGRALQGEVPRFRARPVYLGFHRRGGRAHHEVEAPRAVACEASGTIGTRLNFNCR